MIVDALAFPQDSQTGNLEDWRHGMTLRDYFAAAALTGLAREFSVAVLTAKDAYEIADEMLKAREK